MIGAAVDQHHLARVGLRQLLERNADIVLVGESYGGIHACGLIEKERPDCVVIDLESETNVMEAVRSYKKIAPQVKILLLSGWGDVERARQALGAGAEGIVLKCQPPSVLTTMIQSEASGLSVEVIAPAVSPTQPDTNHHSLAQSLPAGSTRGTGSLTDRERAVGSSVKGSPTATSPTGSVSPKQPSAITSRVSSIRWASRTARNC